MKQRWAWTLVLISSLSFIITACGNEPVPTIAPPAPLEATATPLVSQTVTAASPSGTLGPQTSSAAARSTPAQSPVPITQTPVKSALSCPATQALPVNAPVAARVNGTGISLDLYNRQVAQAQAAFLLQGIDVKTPSGQEALKSLKLQVLDQMINDVVLTQKAAQETPPIVVTDNDLNARLAQMIQDAGSVDKLNEYLNRNQLSLADFCAQIRSSIVGEAMLDKVTAAFPTTAEQVHVRQILVATPALAQTLRDRARKGEDFAALAKQYSIDEVGKANGGDLGWVPEHVLAPELDTLLFKNQLPNNQVSDVITTQFGYHIVQVLERQKSRPLPPEVLQNQRQQAFLVWLEAERKTMKIEILVQP